MCIELQGVKLNYRSVGNNRCFCNSKTVANVRKNTIMKNLPAGQWRFSSFFVCCLSSICSNRWRSFQQWTYCSILPCIVQSNKIFYNAFLVLFCRLWCTAIRYVSATLWYIDYLHTVAAVVYSMSGDWLDIFCCSQFSWSHYVEVAGTIIQSWQIVRICHTAWY